MKLFLHHLLHAFPSLAVGDVDKIDARGQGAEVHRELFALAFDRGHALAEGVDDLGLLEVSAQNGDLTVGWIGVEGSEGGVLVNAIPIKASLAYAQWIVGNGAIGHFVDGNIYP